jgi:hypothetical protein
LNVGENFRRFSFRQQDNLELKPKLIGWEDVGWINVAQDGDIQEPIVIMIVNHQVP